MPQHNSKSFLSSKTDGKQNESLMSIWNGDSHGHTPPMTACIDEDVLSEYPQGAQNTEVGLQSG